MMYINKTINHQSSTINPQPSTINHQSLVPRQLPAPQATIGDGRPWTMCHLRRQERLEDAIKRSVSNLGWSPGYGNRNFHALPGRQYKSFLFHHPPSILNRQPHIYQNSDNDFHITPKGVTDVLPSYFFYQHHTSNDVSIKISMGPHGIVTTCIPIVGISKIITHYELRIK